MQDAAFLRDVFWVFFQAYQAAFERNLQKKDDLIEALNNLMNQNDEEYDNAFDMHIHNIDNILGKVNWYYQSIKKRTCKLYFDNLIMWNYVP